MVEGAIAKVCDQAEKAGTDLSAFETPKLHLERPCTQSNIEHINQPMAV
jgi:hypothetical protein